MTRYGLRPERGGEFVFEAKDDEGAREKGLEIMVEEGCYGARLVRRGRDGERPLLESLVRERPKDDWRVRVVGSARVDLVFDVRVPGATEVDAKARALKASERLVREKVVTSIRKMRGVSGVDIDMDVEAAVAGDRGIPEFDESGEPIDVLDLTDERSA